MLKNLQIIVLLIIRLVEIQKLVSTNELSPALILNLVVCHRSEGTIQVETTMPLASIHRQNLFNNTKAEAVELIFSMLPVMQHSQ